MVSQSDSKQPALERIMVRIQSHVHGIIIQMFRRASGSQILARYLGKLHSNRYLILVYGQTENGLVLCCAPRVIPRELPAELFQLSVYMRIRVLGQEYT